jgi:hypothetical protein
MKTPLEEFPNIRKWTFRVMWIAVVLVGALQIGWQAQTGSTPSWIITALAVLGYLGGAIGFTADRNLTRQMRNAAPKE